MIYIIFYWLDFVFQDVLIWKVTKLKFFKTKIILKLLFYFSIFYFCFHFVSILFPRHLFCFVVVALLFLLFPPAWWIQLWWVRHPLQVTWTASESLVGVGNWERLVSALPSYSAPHPRQVAPRLRTCDTHERAKHVSVPSVINPKGSSWWQA